MEITGDTAGISFNLDEQRVLIPRKLSVQSRTVYRIEKSETGIFSGSVLSQGQWIRVELDADEGVWFPRQRRDTLRWNK